ncbi:MAG: hypothetical protein DRR08_13125 [Candidatus Parabeggiatoa sp. nov. 2]|nr:MAG: hypothetical protein B6247_05825 [Beggiatoa sp. 4572_84]RKZ59729.1 MAG: hypothetical protein DRR08_13125 [Gammaproteobacteria bacterium]
MRDYSPPKAKVFPMEKRIPRGCVIKSANNGSNILMKNEKAIPQNSAERPLFRTKINNLGSITA